MYPIFNPTKLEITKNFILLLNEKDQWFMLRNKSIVFFGGTITLDNICYVQGRVVESQSDFYTEPIKSSNLNIYKSNGILSNVRQNFSLSDVYVKLFKIPVSGSDLFVFVPERHTYIS